MNDHTDAFVRERMGNWNANASCRHTPRLPNRRDVDEFARSSELKARLMIGRFGWDTDAL